MLFRSVATCIVGVLFTQGALAALTPARLVTSIEAVTAASKDANTALVSISTSTKVADVKTSGKKLVAAFTTIVQSVTADVAAINVTPAFADDAADTVVNALTDFVLVHQILLSTVIGKHSIFAQFAVTTPITAILRALEAQVDALAFGLINLIPTRKPDVQESRKSLDASLTIAISTYREVCIPSPFYPSKGPTCVSV
ncbi:hypothetical protein CVT25_013889 [Psilocybe cyanescens]|uniref:Cell wall galactomannoprotein n=1 Tax=Psilocybe cyanescens TaxID=93625 RepID=A0A409XZ18_PSICY|nr:hypothetical protein CVT25_013889 [Psilocybe cyanescens]